jgi:DNA replication and repair protein RecF
MSVAQVLPARSSYGPVGRSLAVRQIRLRDFRNYARLDLDAGMAPVVLTGENGAGKTNLLEAISLLAPGRGLRRARLGDLVRTGAAGGFRLEAEIEARDGPSEIVVWAEGERRMVEVDGRSLRSQNELGALTSLVWLVPMMDRLFLEGPAGRRRFLDRLVLAVQPDHARNVAAYERGLRERSTLLREGRHDPAWLVALERNLAEAGVAVAAARVELVRELDAALAAARLPFPHPTLAVHGEIEGWLGEAPAIEVEDRFAEALASGRRTDAGTGGAGTGPHRTELMAQDAWTGEPADRCSTGRQKAFLASIVVAQAQLRRAKWGDLPIVLLDEITAHLDWRRRRELFEALLALGAQCWMTGTEVNLFMGLRGQARFFTVADGTIADDD